MLTLALLTLALLTLALLTLALLALLTRIIVTARRVIARFARLRRLLFKGLLLARRHFNFLIAELIQQFTARTVLAGTTRCWRAAGRVFLLIAGAAVAIARAAIAVAVTTVRAVAVTTVRAVAIIRAVATVRAVPTGVAAASRRDRQRHIQQTPAFVAAQA